MTPVDTLDTLLLMGLDEEAGKARALIVERLSFDKDISVKNFEITIRILGGLLSGYQMTGDERLLRLAEDLGRRLLPAFDSPTGHAVHVRQPEDRQDLAARAPTRPRSARSSSNSARSRGSPASRSSTTRRSAPSSQLYDRRSPLGLVGEEIDVETGELDQPQRATSAAASTPTTSTS